MPAQLLYAARVASKSQFVQACLCTRICQRLHTAVCAQLALKYHACVHLPAHTRVQDRLDPIDWATYEPHLWANVQHYYQRTAVLLGSLTQLQRAYPEGGPASGAGAAAGAGRPTAPAAGAPAAAPGGRARDLNPMNVLPVAPRFQYLPISIPSIARGAGTAGSHALVRMQTGERTCSGQPRLAAAGAQSGLPKPLCKGPLHAQQTGFGAAHRLITVCVCVCVAGLLPVHAQ